MPRRPPTKKISVKRGKTVPAIPKKISRKDMRFSISLVILIGMLSFFSMLLLISLNKPSAVEARTQVIKTAPNKNAAVKQSGNRIIDDRDLDFKLTMPSQLGQWSYRTGDVKSLTDDSLSNRYVQIMVPIPGAKSNNVEEQNKSILTIRKFSEEEWKDVTESCQNDKKDICDAAGVLIKETTDSEDNGWAYSYTKFPGCPKSIEAKCNLVDKIIESFQLK